MHLVVDSNITLKEIALSDVIDIFNLIDSQREYLGKWLPFVAKTKDVSYTESYITSVLNAPKDRKEHNFTIRKQDKIIGLIGFKSTSWINKKTEIGYWLSEKYQKQGIVTKSVQKLCAFAFSNLELNRIEIKCAVENYPSKNIPQKLGFIFEGVQREAELVTENVFRDLEVYSKLKND